MIKEAIPLRHRRISRWERGQSLVETAIASVFFLVFLLGVFDLGRAYFIYVALEDSAGEAATFLSVNPTCDTGVSCPDPNNGVWRAENAAGENLNWDNATVTVTYPTGGKSTGNLVRVRVSYPFTLVTPIISNIVGSNTLTMNAEATQVILME